MKKVTPASQTLEHLYLLLIKIAVLETALLVILRNIKHHPEMASLQNLIYSSSVAHALVMSALVFVVIQLFAMIWRGWLFVRYKPTSLPERDKLPACSVVVPAFNEGEQVYHTLINLAASDYPADKLQLIAIDDGSADDTWSWIEKARAELGSRLTAIRQPRNMGKRHGLYAGFQKATGEIFITVDSDSMVESQSIMAMVAPFVADDRVGAVAGNVRVLNREKGLIPRMLDVVFHFSFDFIRAGQSSINGVLCTPGALSAYRKSAVMPVLEQWLNQTFLGRSANIGEDRAMTNMILAQGYHTRYQQNAVVITEVPIHYRNLYKMLLRWARSNVRETLMLSRFAFKNIRPEGGMTGTRINLILSWITLTHGQWLLLTTLFWALQNPMLYTWNILGGALVGSLLPMTLFWIRRRSSDAILMPLYNIFWMLCLSWIPIWASLTPHNSRWLTRTLPQSREATLESRTRPAI